MNHVAEEMRAILEGDEDVLMHYGMPRRSGRYPWGSGEDPYQHGKDFFVESGFFHAHPSFFSYLYIVPQIMRNCKFFY